MDNKEIIKKLRSEKLSIVLDTLKYIKKEGNKGLLYEVIDILYKTNETVIREEAIQIIENLNDQDSVPIIMDAIENPDYKNILNILVASCWKNGLKFNEYIKNFTEIFIQSDFLLAFEVFTVIDNFDYIDSQLANTCLVRLESSVEDITKDKEALYYELIGIIKNTNENPAN
ncbi:MAG: hypothetical protein PF485_07255 [Bacteroidales bacterium]|jgi:hypothetical protein|nr:hypothetical protein [Bacteroidales bacterium]